MSLAIVVLGDWVDGIGFPAIKVIAPFDSDYDAEMWLADHRQGHPHNVVPYENPETGDGTD